jgi:hypothetical protein
MKLKEIRLINIVLNEIGFLEKKAESEELTKVKVTEVKS